jgi:spermidine synthase
MANIPRTLSTNKSQINIYIGTFIISFSSLALEVTITRLLSVITLYHLAFFAVSLAMLGMTAGAVTVYLKPQWFSPYRLNNSIARSCLGYSIITPLSLFFLSRLPVGLQVNAQDILSLIQLTIACLLPFYFSGLALTAVLTKYKLPIGKLYSSDLAGASLGCLFVLGAMQIMDAPTLILLSSLLSTFAAISFVWPPQRFGLRHANLAITGVLIFLVTINAATPYGIRPLFVKGNYDDPKSHFLEKWNSFSRVVVYQQENKIPAYWGASPKAPWPNVLQYRTDIDGGAGTWITKYSSNADIDYLRYDATNLVHYIRPNGSVCIIGSGGGRDVQSALLFGHTDVTGIDVNSIFINLLQNQFKYFAGVAGRPGVKLVADEARSYLARTPTKYTVVQMSLVDTWAATAAGAFSLSENGLYTVEAWKTFFDRLTDDGIFTASRHYLPDTLDETGRAVSLAMATLFSAGVSQPSQNLAVVAAYPISTLLMSKQPFSDADVQQIRDVSSQLGYDPIVLPGETPQNKVLNHIISARSLTELESSISVEPLNYQPTWDDNPYFFNMLRLNHLEVINWKDSGVLSGNISATFTLAVLIMALMVICILGIALPLLLRSRRQRDGGSKEKILWSGAVYFSLIGAGFMFVEMGLMQRLSVFLGHPVYGLGILLFTIIASAGIGSYFSDRLPLVRFPWIIVYPVSVAALILAMRFILPLLGSNMAASPIIIKIIVSIGVIAPLGMLMGVCFPTGMRLVRLTRSSETPWYWALNGMFGVLCSALAVFVSIYVNISTSLYIGIGCYLLILLAVPGLIRQQVSYSEPEKSGSKPEIHSPLGRVPEIAPKDIT